MFEQESYDRATEPTVVSQPGELFYNYEMKSWFSSQTLYKVLAISAVINLAFLAAVSQTNVLTARGCDSPWVGRVCQVVDMAYVGAVLFGTEREYVDQAYEKTDLGDAEITYIDVTNVAPPLDYPEGYFQIANPVAYQNRLLMQQQGTAVSPGSSYSSPMYNPVPNNDSDILKQRANPPAANPGAFTDDSPDSSLVKVQDTPSTGAGTFASRKKRGGGRVDVRPSDSNSTKPDDKTVAETEPNPRPTPTASPTDPVVEVKINRQVMKDFGKGVAEKLDNKQVDLAQNFKVTAVATLTDEGKFDLSIDPKTKEKRSRVLTGEGDPEMIKVVTEAIAAIGDSGWLGYLSNQGIKNITFTFEQNDQELTANIVSVQLSANKAKTLSGALTNSISGAFLLDKMKVKVLGEDEKALLSAAAATSDGKKVVLNFKFPKPAAQEMIQRNIQKAKEAETGLKENGLLSESATESRTIAK